MQELAKTSQQISADHLFISYASEDAALAEWLTLKLTVEGYRVWCDRIKLLGGESYPNDIDLALKTSTFRVLALMSHHSIHKPNPVKERTTALNISRDRKVDFLIPLNVDGLSPTELDWMTSDLTFIPFDRSWAEGLNRLLRKLTQIHAPRDEAWGKESGATWANNEDNLAHREETVWSNALPILELPSRVRKYLVKDEDALARIRPYWPLSYAKPHIWTFAIPKDEQSHFSESASFPVLSTFNSGSTKVGDVVTHLLRRSMALYCIQRGLKRTEDGRDIYFPEGLLADDKLPYSRYDGKKVFVKAIGRRKLRLVDGITRKSIYHLAPTFRPLTRRFGFPCYEINMRIVWTDVGSNQNPSGSNRRRRTLTKTWWNYQWLSRILAFTSWLTEGEKTRIIFSSEQGNISISGLPISTRSSVGINEDALTPASMEEDESEILSESDESDEIPIEQQTAPLEDVGNQSMKQD